eukprot:m.159214 g.159214  ORF g.159214 m.159214 type:complete len:423 (-) comp17997_c1_seq1:40-1308(-)
MSGILRSSRILARDPVNRNFQYFSWHHKLQARSSLTNRKNFSFVNVYRSGIHCKEKCFDRSLSMSAPLCARRIRPGNSKPDPSSHKDYLEERDSASEASTQIVDEKRDLIARELALMLGVSEREAHAMIEDEHDESGSADDKHLYNSDVGKDTNAMDSNDDIPREENYPGDTDDMDQDYDARRFEETSQRRGGRLDLDKFVQDERLAAVFGKGSGNTGVPGSIDEDAPSASDANFDADEYAHSLGVPKPDPPASKELVKFRLGGIPTPGGGIGEFGARGNIRSRRISGAIQRTINEALHRGELGAELQSLGLEIESVEFGKGLRKADIWWHSTQDTQKDFQLTVAIQQQARAIRRVVAQKMNMKFTPEFKWRVTTVRADEKEIDEMFAKVSEEIRAYDSRLEKEELAAKLSKKKIRLRSQEL